MADTLGPALFIGGGTMATAIITRGLASGSLGDSNRVGVVEPDSDRRAAFGRGFETIPDGLSWLQETESEACLGSIVLAVKPQVFPAIADELASAITASGNSRLVISILAGTRSSSIRASLGELARVVRVMPSTPAKIGRGCSAVSKGDGSTDEDAARVVALFESISREVLMIDEEGMNAFTGVAGSGPAYVFYVVEALERSAIDVGFSRENAQRLARETVAGASALLDASEASAAELRAGVTSKNGTTQAATDSLDRDDVMESVARAVRAARDRGVELGG